MDDAFQGRDMSTIKDLKRVLRSTAGYVDDAKDWTEKQFQGKLSESLDIGRQKLEKFGNHPFFRALKDVQNSLEHEDADSEGV
mmetsp:Transcript_29786/g.55888  ORF Transcript_29786/g.55888 Transcript_29786/m.55888 type:complete len:83 (+) Transcript_29786:401-649(+)